MIEPRLCLDRSLDFTTPTTLTGDPRVDRAVAHGAEKPSSRGFGCVGQPRHRHECVLDDILGRITPGLRVTLQRGGISVEQSSQSFRIHSAVAPLPSQVTSSERTTVRDVHPRIFSETLTIP